MQGRAGSHPRWEVSITGQVWMEAVSQTEDKPPGCWQSCSSHIHLCNWSYLAIATPPNPVIPLTGTCNLVRIRPPKMASRMVMLPSNCQHASGKVLAYTWAQLVSSADRTNRFLSLCSDSMPGPCPASRKSLRCLGKGRKIGRTAFWIKHHFGLLSFGSGRVK